MEPDRRSDRQAALRRRIADAGFDALLVTHGANIRYLTGFTGSAGMVLVTANRIYLLTDFRYADQAPAEAGGAADVIIELANLWDRLKKLLDPLGRIRLGFEREHLTVRDAERLNRLDAEVGPASDLVEALRTVKDSGEVAAIREAAALAQSALAEILYSVRPGQTEQQIAARLEQALRLRGSEWHPFQTIVASGPRSALPHARSSGRVVERGDILLIDFGAEVRGYCSDLTRTVIVGRNADARQREVYAVVEAAQRKARSEIAAGMTGRAADALARDPIDRAGFGSAFGHSLGHGIGLEVHEGPRLARLAEEALPAGAVVTIEPGIYLEGWGGVRLEDDVHLSVTGPELLSDGRTELLEIH